MKKWMIGLLVVIVLSVASVYVFIPGTLSISESVIINSNSYSAGRLLQGNDTWQKWWPQKNTNNAPALSFNGYTFQVSKVLYHAAEVNISSNSKSHNSKVVLIPLPGDSTIAAQWETAYPASLNPFKRISEYLQAVDLKKNMDTLLNSYKSFVEKTENVYGFHIIYTTLQDTTLVAKKLIVTGYPSTTFIYGLVKELRGYINTQAAKETNVPMLNVRLVNADSSHYEVLVAIPTNRALSGNKNIFFKQLRIMKDKILATEVKGGPATIEQGYTAIRNFMVDYRHAAPVLPFQYMVTDRSKETDTSKWITKIYYPIR